jgi:hypothetical protein
MLRLQYSLAELQARDLQLPWTRGGRMLRSLTTSAAVAHKEVMIFFRCCYITVDPATPAQ